MKKILGHLKKNVAVSWFFFISRFFYKTKKVAELQGSYLISAKLPCFESPDMAIENFPAATLCLSVRYLGL